MDRHAVRTPLLTLVGLLVGAMAVAADGPQQAASVCQMEVAADVVVLTCVPMPPAPDTDVDPVTAGYDQLDRLGRLGIDVRGGDVRFSPAGQEPTRGPRSTVERPAGAMRPTAGPGEPVSPHCWTDGPVTYLVVPRATGEDAGRGHPIPGAADNPPSDRGAVSHR